MKSSLIFTLLFFCNGVFAQATNDSVGMDTVVIHIIYGSKPKTKNEKHWFGGKLGGHIGLQYNKSRIMHFVPNGHVNGFNAFSDTGKFLNSSISNFYRTFPGEGFKTVKIAIPVTKQERDSIEAKCKRYFDHAPYPYAFFGMRCAAATYDMLSPVITPARSQRKMTFAYFTPRKFRKYIFKEAELKGWKMVFTPGNKDRKWDHD